jgi:hypothetical protein
MLRVSRLWRNLKYRKWHGFGHAFDPNPGPGELALFCAACPQPGVNLPDGWRDDPDQSVSADSEYTQDCQSLLTTVVQMEIYSRLRIRRQLLSGAVKDEESGG